MKTSKTRGIYFLRLIGRIMIFLSAIIIYAFDRDQFAIADGWDFFREYSPLHLLWIIWMCNMALQFIPVRSHVSIGSLKVFGVMFRPAEERPDKRSLRRYMRGAATSAYKIMLIWILLTVVIGILHLNGIIDTGAMILLSAFFYVCDMICILIWCPFRLIMKNKCCTTCRIFNWDYLMMFLPIITVNSFYSWTLVVFAFLVWLVWETCVAAHPERFWEESNIALRCSECTDKLCTQYCGKLRNRD